VLYAFGFDRLGVVVSDLYFVDPRPAPGQEGAERGVRLEVRMLRQGELKGSIYSARPIEVGEPVWRADLLEVADGPPGSLNRAHYHPAFSGWNPGHRVFDRGLSAGAVQWAGVSDVGEFAADAESLRTCVPEIKATVQGLLDRVETGELATAPAGDQPESARVSWL